ncbi:MAG: hypothetical protein CTY20_00680 [Hyphomicrobium sp.]|nr:MAG: hypothetical protein CTY20_00680 [Hyphomicrobium sp.]
MAGPKSKIDEAEIVSLTPGEIPARTMKLIERQLALINAAQARLAKGLTPIVNAKGENMGTELDAAQAASALNALTGGMRVLAGIHALFEGRALSDSERQKPKGDAASAAAAEKLLAVLRAEEAQVRKPN